MAQDPIHAIYANPLYLNPAFAGAQRCPRVCLTTVTNGRPFDRYVRYLHGVLRPAC